MDAITIDHNPRGGISRPGRPVERALAVPG